MCKCAVCLWLYAVLSQKCTTCAGVFAQAGSSFQFREFAAAVADTVVERQQAVPDAIECRLSSVGSADMQAIQSRLNVRTRPAQIPPQYRRDPANVPRFDWQPFPHEDDAALAAMQFMQEHFAPEDVVFIAIQSVRWLGFQWPKERISLRTGRTDVLGAFTGEGGQGPAMKLIGIQQRLAELKGQLTEAQTQLQATKQNAPRKEAPKRQRAESSQAIQALNQARGLQAECEALNGQRAVLVLTLLLHTVMVYGAKHPTKLQLSINKYR